MHSAPEMRVAGERSAVWFVHPGRWKAPRDQSNAESEHSAGDGDGHAYLRARTASQMTPPSTSTTPVITFWRYHVSSVVHRDRADLMP